MAYTALALMLLAGLLLWTSGATARPADKDKPGAGDGAPRFAPDRILVKTEEGISASSLEGGAAGRGARVEEEIPGTDVAVVEVPEGLPVEEAVERYEDAPGVEYAEPDFVLKEDQARFSARRPNDPRFPSQYGLHNTGQTGGAYDADIDAPGAWGVTTGSRSAVVAVVDSGNDVRHPDLKGNIWVNADEISGNRRDDDGNGYVDDVNGWDFHHGDNTLYHGYAEDDHGTHVAGIIAAQGNNGTGITGVAWRAGIMPLKYVGPNGWGYTSHAVEAINYATENGADVINVSSGCSDCFSQALLDAVKRANTAGVLVTTTAGNTAGNNDAGPRYPCNYASSNIVCVAATGYRDGLAGFSNYGSRSVDLAAPGIDVPGTVPGGSYASYTGTSQAAPHVAGVAALIKSRYPSLDDGAIKSRIMRSVDRKSGLSGKTVSGGRLNAAGALKAR